MILDKIVSTKKQILDKAKKECDINILRDIAHNMPETSDFANALKNQRTDTVNIIAEVKKASPSRGIIQNDFHPVTIAQNYEKYGAAAISVLTETAHFQGNLHDLKSIAEKVQIPILRKDFLFDPYQLYEARANGADAVLLIAAILEKQQLNDLLALAVDLSLAALVEVHTPEELETVLESRAEIIGINNRNLKTFITDINTTIELAAAIPAGKIIVSESGIKNTADIKKLLNVGVDAFLIGETFMREKNPGDKLNEFVNLI